MTVVPRPRIWGPVDDAATDALRATLVGRRDLINDFFEVFNPKNSADLEQMEGDAALMEQLNWLIRAIDGGLLKRLACEAERKDVTASTTAEQPATSADAVAEEYDADKTLALNAAEYVASLFDGCSDAQLAGDACANCGGDLTTVGVQSRSVPDSLLFIHADVALCVEGGAR